MTGIIQLSAPPAKWPAGSAAALATGSQDDLVRQFSLDLEDTRHAMDVLLPPGSVPGDPARIKTLCDRLERYCPNRHPPASEIKAFLRCSTSEAAFVRSAITNGGTAGGKPQIVATPDLCDDTAGWLRELMDADIDWPETALSAQYGDLMHAVPACDVASVAAMTGPISAKAAKTDCVLLRWHRAGKDVSFDAYAWSAIEDLEFDIMAHSVEAKDFYRAIPDYLAGRLCQRHSAGLRLKVVKLLSAAWGRAEAYAWNFPELREEVLGFTLPKPDYSQSELDVIKAFKREGASRSHLNRKEAAGPFAADLDRNLAIALALVESAETFKEMVDDAEDHMRKHGMAVQDFSYETRGMAEDGTFLACIVSHHFRLSQRTTFEASLPDFNQALPLPQDSGNGASEFVAEFLHSQYIAHDDVDLDKWTGRTCPLPAFARHARDGVLLNPKHIPRPMLEMRFAELAGTDIPFAGRFPASLCAPDKALRPLIGCALSEGRIIVDIVPYLHGLLFAAAALFSIGMSFCRASEMRQMFHGGAGWTDVDDGNRKTSAFYAIPKCGVERQSFALPSMTMEILSKLVAFTLERDGIDAVQICAATADLKDKTEPSPFIFAFRRRMLSVGDLNDLLAVLFAGIVSVRTHDIRHAVAMRAWNEGYSVDTISAWMKVAGGCTPDYCADPMGVMPRSRGEADADLAAQLGFTDTRADRLALSSYRWGVSK